MSSIGFDKMWDPMGIGRKKKKGEETKMADIDAAQKRRWISHMVLQQDGISDPEGIKLRPVKGLKGCAYLDPGAITNALSYVFGPFIETLEDAGYIDEINLNAVPYDWRLPPYRLEERDGYFSDVQRIIEKMVRDNGSKVVVVAHSLGNRVMHYFCKFMEKKCGRQWVTDHVDCWIALGPLWLGAPKLLRAIVTGDRMGLDAFLFPEEGIALGRSLGSSAWMFPYVTSENEFQSYCQYKNKKTKKFETKSNQEILVAGGAEIVWKKYYDYYHSHPLVGPPEEVFKAPPIDKLYAIYGINLKTEAYYFFKDTKSKNNTLTPLQLAPEGSVPNLKCEGGIGFETKNTRQNVLKGQPRAGDGTVPYASLSYCKKWSKDIQVRVVEIEGAEHREILKNKTMITLVLEYVMQAPPPSVLPQNFQEITYDVNIQAKNKLAGRQLFLGREYLATLSKSGSKTKGKHFYEKISDVRLQTDGKGFIIEFENCPPYAFKSPASETIVNDISARCRYINNAKKSYTEDRNEFGQTALHIAAMDNSIDDVIALLKSGSDVNAVDSNGWTPLITAADKGNLEVILCLLQTNDIDIDRAAINTNFTVVHKLASAAINSEDEAQVRKFLGVMRMLKSKGANLSAKAEMGELPIHMAVKRGNITAVAWFGENGVNINAVNTAGETPLHYAVRSSNEAIMSKLCQLGANKHAEALNGETPLSISRKNPDLFAKLQNMAITTQKISAPPVSKFEAGITDEYGQTNLHRAAYEDRLDDVFEIISKDVTAINVQDKNGWTPLHSAASQGNLEVFLVLLNMPSADVTIATHNDTTVLHYLIRKKFEGAKLTAFIDTLNRLKEKGLDVNFPANKGIIPLHEACIYSSYSGVEWLLSHGADINYAAESGDTALHFAIRSGSKEIVALLIKNGANINAVSKFDGTPSDLARAINPSLLDTIANTRCLTNLAGPRKNAVVQKKNIFRASVMPVNFNYNLANMEETFETVDEDEEEIYGREEEIEDEADYVHSMNNIRKGGEVTRNRSDSISMFQKAPPVRARGGMPPGVQGMQYRGTPPRATNSPPVPHFNNNNNSNNYNSSNYNSNNNYNIMNNNHSNNNYNNSNNNYPPPPNRGQNARGGGGVPPRNPPSQPPITPPRTPSFDNQPPQTYNPPVVPPRGPSSSDLRGGYGGSTRAVPQTRSASFEDPNYTPAPEPPRRGGSVRGTSNLNLSEPTPSPPPPAPRPRPPSDDSLSQTKPIAPLPRVNSRGGSLSSRGSSSTLSHSAEGNLGRNTPPGGDNSGGGGMMPRGAPSPPGYGGPPGGGHNAPPDVRVPSPGNAMGRGGADMKRGSIDFSQMPKRSSENLARGGGGMMPRGGPPPPGYGGGGPPPGPLGPNSPGSGSSPGPNQRNPPPNVVGQRPKLQQPDYIPPTPK